MKIIYFGTDVFFSMFQWLLNSQHEIVSLYTYYEPDEHIRNERICALARQHQIPVSHERISEAEIINAFATKQCDLLLSAEYDAKIPVPMLPSFRGINIHNSLLPEGRGYFPIEMRLFYGYDYGGISIHKLAEKFDMGDILMQRRFPILQTENERAIYAKCDALALDMIKPLLDNFDTYWDNATAQGGGSYWQKPKVEDYTVNQAMTIAKIEHIYRSFGPFTRIELDGKLHHVEHIATDNTRLWVGNDAILDRQCIKFQACDGVVDVYLQCDS